MIQILESLHHAHENNTEGGDIPGVHDIFQLQHHHLLMCLERTTVSVLLPAGVPISILYGLK